MNPTYEELQEQLNWYEGQVAALEAEIESLEEENFMLRAGSMAPPPDESVFEDFYQNQDYEE